MMTLTLRQKSYELKQRVLLMGILNVTPDSFSDGPKFQKIDSLKRFLDDANKYSVDIIDIGGESTRPNADPVSLNEELRRVLPAIEFIRKNSDIPISIDSYKSVVAEQAIEHGADLINDISGGTFDENMFRVAAKYALPYIMMHIQGNPKNMQVKPSYSNLLAEINHFFATQIKKAEALGVQTIIIDPGIGFGKSVDDNFQLIKELDYFKALKKIILLGASRKSFLAGSMELPPQQREIGTAIVHSQAILNGARIIRSHHLNYARQAIELSEHFLNL